jgi:hypothetical protein
VPILRKRLEDVSERWESPTGCRLWLADVDALLAILGKLGAVMVDTPEVSGTLANADELADAYRPRKAINNMTLIGGSDEDTITVHLVGLPVVLIRSGGNLALIGALEQVKEVLRSRSKRGFARPKSFALGATVGILVASVWSDPVHSASSAGEFLSAVGHWLRSSYQVAYSLFIPLLIGGLVVAAVVSAFAPNAQPYVARWLGPSSSVVLRQRPGSFLLRNWEGIVVNLGTGVVTMVAGVVYEAAD